MKKYILSSLLLLAVLSGSFIYSCKKIAVNSNPNGLVPSLPAQALDYLHVTVSGNFLPFSSNIGTREEKLEDVLSVSPSANTSVTNDGATLGRVLFYDKIMSINNSVACASCHKQSTAFADPKAASEGYGGKFTPRNSMTIINPFMNNNMFWDSRTPTVTMLTLQPVFNHLEMGMESMGKLVDKISKTSYYPDLFNKAFGSSEVTADKISNAMTQFLCSMVSADSRFDRGESNEFADFSPLEKHGRELFFGTEAKCSQCHAGENFSAPDFPGGAYGSGGGSGSEDKKGAANIGLDKVYKDNGRGEGLFRIPSLRNVALTAPYMHDGRFTSLDQVIEHYNSGIQNHKNLDSKLKGTNGMPQRLALSEYNKLALVAFLKTLTDENITSDKKFSDPFSR